VKHIKQYEKISTTPKVGDYVLLHFDFSSEPDLYKPIYGVSNSDITNYINNTIGQIYKIDNGGHSPYFVEYKDVPYNLKFWFAKDKDVFFRTASANNIWYISSNIEDLKKVLLSKLSQKYNL